MLCAGAIQAHQQVKAIGSSIYRPEYQQMLALLRAAREQAGLTQYDLAKRLGRSQSYVGKCELGERRLDVVQLRDFCAALGVPFLDFVRRFEEEVASGEHEQSA